MFCLKTKIGILNRCASPVPASPLHKPDITSGVKKDTQLIDLINESYLTDYAHWLKILAAMYHSGYTMEDAHAVSRRAGNYDASAMDKKWEEAGKLTQIGMGTLYYYAKESNPAKYLELRKATMPSLDTDGAMQLATDFHHMFGHDWVYHQEQRYFFDGFIWKKETAASNYMQRALSMQLVPIYSEKHLKCIQENNTKDAAIYHGLMKKATKMSAMKECGGHLDTKVMVDDLKWDQNPDTFYFKNFVFDLKTGKQTQPDREQHVMMTTGYDYVPPTHAQCMRIAEIIEQALPIPSERELYCTVLASGLVGRQLDKFTVANGSGGNSKSVLHGIMKSTCGNYYHELNTATLTNLQKTEMCQDLANLHNKRIVLAAEPDEKTGFQIGIIKNLTGNTTINARGMYEKSTEVRVTATVICECNRKPKLDGRMDDAIERRLLDVPFRSSFKSDPENHHGDFVFLKDTSLVTESFAEEHRCALFNFLLPYVQKLYALNFNIDQIIPESIKQRNLAYMEDSDEFKTWLDDHYEKGGDDYVKAADML